MMQMQPKQVNAHLTPSAKATKVPTSSARSWGTVWNGSYVLQSSDRMEHVCTGPEALGLMLSHFWALQHSVSLFSFGRRLLLLTLKAQNNRGVSGSESAFKIWFVILNHDFITWDHYFCSNWLNADKLSSNASLYWQLLPTLSIWICWSIFCCVFIFYIRKKYSYSVFQAYFNNTWICGTKRSLVDEKKYF